MTVTSQIREEGSHRSPLTIKASSPSVIPCTMGITQQYNQYIDRKTAFDNGIREAKVTNINNLFSGINMLHGRRNRLIMQTTKNRKFPPVGNSLLYISLLSVALIASFTSRAILNDLFAICNSRLLPTNQIVNYAGRVRPIQGRTLFLFCI